MAVLLAVGVAATAFVVTAAAVVDGAAAKAGEIEAVTKLAAMAAAVASERIFMGLLDVVFAAGNEVGIKTPGDAIASEALRPYRSNLRQS